MSPDRKLQSVLTAVLLAMLAAVLPASASSDSPPTRRLSRQVFLPAIQTRSDTSQGRGLLPPADESQTYVLQFDDNLADLAFDLGRDVSLMACVTADSHVPLHELRPGQTITVPSARFVCHTVQTGETLADVAARYQVDVQVIVGTPWNRLDRAETTLESGQRLLIFDAVRPENATRSIPEPAVVPEPAIAEPPAAPAVEESLSPAAPAAPAATEIWPFGDGNFVWPVRAAISQEYRRGHRAIDVAAPFGREVLAADNGVVKMVGWTETGYGLRVVIDHKIDFTTLYAHLSEVFVEEGQVVEKGQVIGRVGSTGNSSGPHLHFEIRDFGYLVDPLGFLPQ